MAVAEYQPYLKLLPTVKQSPQREVWLSSDAEADTLYINFNTKMMKSSASPFSMPVNAS